MFIARKQNFKPFDRKVWLSSPTMHGEELEYVREAYETNWMSTVGKNIDELERLVAEKVGTKQAVALSCGTAALHLAVKLAGLEPGEPVFCSAVFSHMVSDLYVCVRSMGHCIKFAQLSFIAAQSRRRIVG